MRTLILIKYLFTLVGVGFLVGAGFLYEHKRSFVAESVEAEGTVIGNPNQPIVSFVDQRGTRIEFTSSVRSDPPRYSKGEQIIVVYRPEAPSEAQIKNFAELYAAATILAGFGAVFASIGVGFFVYPLLQSRRQAALLASGIPVETDFQSVELNTAISVNGRHPFRVLTQWLNPSTSKVHVFKSRNLWFDPTAYLDDRRITVYLAPGNPKKYFVDVSFLPELAD